MVGRTNHFKHTPGMGLAIILLAGGLLVGFPAALMLLALVINLPWIVIPLVGVLGLVVHLRQRRIRAQDVAIIRQLRVFNESFESEQEAMRRNPKQFIEDSLRQDKEMIEEFVAIQSLERE